MGWNGSDRRGNSTPVQPKAAAKKPSPVRGIVAGLVVVILALAGAWYFLGDSLTSAAPKAKKTKTIKEVKPIKNSMKTNAVERIAKPKTVEDVMQNLETIPKPEIPKKQLSPEEWDRLTNRTFKTGTEQLMSWVFSTMPGDMPIPIPPISEEDRRDITSILISKNPMKEGDSEMTAFCKEQVDLAKKEMAKYIGDGGDPDGFLQYYFQELKLAFDKRNDAVEQLRETNEEDPEIAQQLLEQINKKFEEDGIRTIHKEELE